MPQSKQRTFALNVKEVQERGAFSGYLSVFDVIDLYREVVAPGAFVNTLSKWKSKGRLPPLLWQHRSAEPLGPFTKMEEDTKGLYFEAQLLVDDIARAKEAYALLRAKAIGGMSIGFNPLEEEYDSRAGIIVLREVDLWEGSLATFPACDAAQVDSVKSRQLIEYLQTHTEGGYAPTVREFENALREAAALSRNDAKAIASLVLGRPQRDAGRQSQATQDGSAVLIQQAVKEFPSFRLILEDSRS